MPIKITQKKVINQIKNITQEDTSKPKLDSEANKISEISIKSFDELIDICNLQKELKLKYELEKNVNLVKFEKGRIEISFNDNLDKEFVKDLSARLFEWTGERWIITFSKIKGEMTIKEREKNHKSEMIDKAKKTMIYKSFLNYFSDAELIDIKMKTEEENND